MFIFKFRLANFHFSSSRKHKSEIEILYFDDVNFIPQNSFQVSIYLHVNISLDTCFEQILVKQTPFLHDGTLNFVNKHWLMVSLILFLGLIRKYKVIMNI